MHKLMHIAFSIVSSNHSVKMTAFLCNSDDIKHQTSTAAVDPQHLKVKVAKYDLPNCPYIINRTSYCLMLIT